MVHAESVNMDDVKAELRRFILKTLLEGEEEVNLTDSTPLVTGGIIDSLNSAKVGAFLERRFGIRVLPEELADPAIMETISSIAALVTTKQSC